ncbi:unnamed protein product [Amoebophrya sp. A120]|nr:unnamed protein product [Amoebophrya sp. A120]|eukprot:GSA120T00000894001.1
MQARRFICTATTVDFAIICVFLEYLLHLFVATTTQEEPMPVFELFTAFLDQTGSFLLGAHHQHEDAAQLGTTTSEHGTTTTRGHLLMQELPCGAAAAPVQHQHWHNSLPAPPFSHHISTRGGATSLAMRTSFLDPKNGSCKAYAEEGDIHTCYVNKIPADFWEKSGQGANTVDIDKPGCRCPDRVKMYNENSDAKDKPLKCVEGK